jgi:hypothetical protein
MVVAAGLGLVEMVFGAGLGLVVGGTSLLFLEMVIPTPKATDTAIKKARIKQMVVLEMPVIESLLVEFSLTTTDVATTVLSR